MLPKHLKIIMDEMATSVGLKSIDEVDVTKEGWFMQHSWDRDTEVKFRDWLIGYLEANKEAQVELSNNRLYKRHIPKLADEIILMWGWKTRHFTGTCVCGHSWDDHHQGVVQNTKYLEEKKELYRMVNGMIGQECEATQFEGVFTPDVEITHEDGRVEHIHYDKPCDCNVYKDKGW